MQALNGGNPLTPRCRSLYTRAHPVFNVEVHPSIFNVVLAQPVNLHAVFPEGGVTTFKGKLAQIGHGEAPLAIGSATPNDKVGLDLHRPRIQDHMRAARGISVSVRNYGQTAGADQEI